MEESALNCISLSNPDIQKSVSHLRQACLDSGFFYVTDHGIRLELMDEVFYESKRFFNLPLHEKTKLLRNEKLRGYTPTLDESLDPQNQVHHGKFPRLPYPPSYLSYPSTEKGSIGVEIGQLGEMVYTAKASAAVWDGGAACGKSYCVVCAVATDPRKPSLCGGKSSIYVTVQGLCSDCEAAISISKFGFAAIVAHPDADIINIEYQPADAIKFPCA